MTLEDVGRVISNAEMGGGSQRSGGLEGDTRIKKMGGMRLEEVGKMISNVEGKSEYGADPEDSGTGPAHGGGGLEAQDKSARTKMVSAQTVRGDEDD